MKYNKLSVEPARLKKIVILSKAGAAGLIFFLQNIIVFAVTGQKKDKLINQQEGILAY